MSVNTKVHHYFSETPPARWDIQKFLEQEFSAQGKAYNHNRALSNWISSLRHLSKDDNLLNASPANGKIESYYLNGTRGHPSDKTIAQKWYDRINRRGKKRKQDAGNLPLPRAQRIKNTFRVTRVNGSVNLHGAGANNATDGTSAVLDDSAEAAAPAAAPDPPPASFACSDSDREEPIETSHLVETLQSLGHLYNKMTNKLALSDGRFLEDLLQTHALSLDELSPAHFFIVDKELLEVVLKDTPDEVARVMDATIRFPPFPEHLRTSMLRYQAAKTTDQCRNIARGSSDDEDVYWIDDVFRHVIKLITKSGDILSYDGLNEGVWDSLVYPPLWDEYLVTIPTIVLQRKEIPLVSCVPYPYRPGRPLHYDGVVQSRTPRSRRTEFAVFEVSRSGTDTRKIAADRDKLIGGCRAMLCSLMEVVEYDAEALSRLVVVGVLHAGRSTQLLTMSCLSRNVLIMSEGPPWELPVDVKKLTALYDVIHDVWKVKWAIQTTEAAVNDFFERKESRELEERGKKWGEENVC